VTTSKRSRSSNDAIYLTLRSAIVDHRLRPGARLPEDTLGQTFGVSRTSIRKVLQQLAMDRLVTLRPNRGAEVSRPTIKEATDVFAARRLIECGCIPQIVERITDADIASLRELVGLERDARRDGDQSQAIRYSAEFHVRLIAVADNELTHAFIGQLTSLSSLVVAVYGSPRSVGCDCGEHDELLQLLESGQTEKADYWMDRHLREIEASLDFADQEDEQPDFAALFGDSTEAS